MSATLDLSVICKTVTTQTGVGFNDEAVSAPNTGAYSLKLKSGVAANQQDIEYSTRRNAVNGDTDLDLTALVHEETGQAINFAKVTGFMVVYHSTTSTEELTLGGAPTNPWITWLIATGDGVKLGAGGSMTLTSPVDGWVVTAGTGMVFRISTSASSDWSLKIWGRTA
jgi:hypothetical protein